jgi:outer membrane protein assembly factor BamB
MKALSSIFALSALVLLAACDRTLEHSFESPDSEPIKFGQHVALNGDRVVIDADQPVPAGQGGQPTWRAYLFDATSGELLRAFDDPNRTTSGSYGSGAALAVEGDRILVGDPYDDTSGSDAGQAYLFDAKTGTLIGTFDDATLDDGSNYPSSVGGFGEAVAIDGDLVLIGEPDDNTYGNGSGQAHLFNASTGAFLWVFDDPTPEDSSTSYPGGFGEAVAIDGDCVLIGEPHGHGGSNRGEAHLFDATSGALLRTFEGYDRFGSAVALDCDHVLIGDPWASDHLGKAHLFDATTGALLRTFEDPTGDGKKHGFGASVALDGNRVLIGAPDAGYIDLDTGFVDFNFFYAGRAYLFDATTGEMSRAFKDPELTLGGDAFGASVALGNNRALIGAPHPVGLTPIGRRKQGRAYLFRAEQNR